MPVERKQFRDSYTWNRSKCKTFLTANQNAQKVFAYERRVAQETSRRILLVMTGLHNLVLVLKIGLQISSEEEPAPKMNYGQVTLKMRLLILVDAVHSMVMNDRRVTFRHIANTVGISMSIQSNLSDVPHMSAIWVLRVLTPDQKMTRL